MRNLILLLALPAILTNAETKKVALSFDDAPRSLTGYYTGIERSERLIEQLKRAGVTDVVFYCNSGSINEETEKRVLLYNNAGFTIANHTHSHSNFNNESFDSFYNDFLRADQLLSKYSNFRKFFRFPYLREGNEIFKRDSMRDALKKHGYTNGYITVDFSDWHLESLFKEALQNNQKMDMLRLKNLYVSLAKESLAHYDHLSSQYLKRSPKHVLLLHETDLAALFIGDLVKALREWNWEVISASEAYTDDIAKFELQQALKFNPGRVGEIALANEHPIDQIWAKSSQPDYISDRFRREVLQINP